MKNIYQSAYFDKLVALNQYFHHFHRAENLTNAFRVLYYMRVIVGKLSFKLYEFHQYINQRIEKVAQSELDHDYYHLGLLESFVHNSKVLIEELNEKLAGLSASRPEQVVSEYEPSKHIYKNVEKMVSAIETKPDLFKKSKECFIRKLEELGKKPRDPSTEQYFETPGSSLETPEPQILSETSPGIPEPMILSETSPEPKTTARTSTYLLFFHSGEKDLINKIQNINHPNTVNVLINTKNNPDLVNHYNVTSIPTLLIRIEDYIYPYKGPIEQADIIKYLSEIVGKPIEFPKELPELILYYADWCPHCQRFKPVWEELKNELGKSKIKLTEVDAVADPERVKQDNVEGYPTIRLVKPQEIVEYKGDRTKEALIDFVNKNI